MSHTPASTLSPPPLLIHSQPPLLLPLSRTSLVALTLRILILCPYTPGECFTSLTQRMAEAPPLPVTSLFPIATEDSANPTAKGPGKDKAGPSPHLSDVLSSREGRRPSLPPCGSHQQADAPLPQVKHRHPGTSLVLRGRGLALGMLLFSTPSLSM